KNISFKEGDIPKVGDILAWVENDAIETVDKSLQSEVDTQYRMVKAEAVVNLVDSAMEEEHSTRLKSRTPQGKYLSPLVRQIAHSEGISPDEIDAITGSGMDGRITRTDLMKHIEGKVEVVEEVEKVEVVEQLEKVKKVEVVEKYEINDSGDEIIPMDRVRKLIAEHMVMSKQTSPHVTTFIDVDVTDIVTWRNKIKDNFLKKEGMKLTLTPIFFEACARAIRMHPMVNVSVDGTNIIKKKNINIGMATALPNGNLIVPVIKKADELSIVGLTREVNDLAGRARAMQLKPDEISGGTFTITNYGTVGNLMGTPIINQPQSAILGIGAVKKMPAVVETPSGDTIGIRHIAYLSLSYDHRVIDGALAGLFVKTIKDMLESFNSNKFLNDIDL
ncbi:MAG: dihydrolipoamide acetyltransferase family protein, partial [Bacteroidales bacterium]|nr:dihydrolipoamide acetyltransferase family protein [Bacteroidales bacterium]